MRLYLIISLNTETKVSLSIGLDMWEFIPGNNQGTVLCLVLKSLKNKGSFKKIDRIWGLFCVKTVGHITVPCLNLNKNAVSSLGRGLFSAQNKGVVFGGFDN